ncbi:MAG: bifunctional class I SAM-dependent methyltransferase/glycosyltransferase family 2 protein [Bacteroidetes bacterium]|nr:bifunctional class I SAM-dependent methyltransferase/glycosyltransferase family 2 protein [Bacteroidota bacterium]
MKMNKDYFDLQATTRIKYRKNRSYYWDSITRYCNYFLHDDLSVLEIGCGTGELIASVKGKRKVGIDFSDAMVSKAREQFPQTEFHVMEAEHLHLDEKFDVIILSNLIGYLNDIQGAFHELHKVCHDRTRIIITYYSFLWEPFIRLAEFIHIKKRAPYQNWLSTKDIINLLYLSGFETYRYNRSLLVPFNIPLLSWFFNNFLGRLPLFNLLTLNRYVFARPFPDTNRLSDKKYSVSVVIPARNEMGNIGTALERLPEFGKHLEIIFIEGHSSDNTWDGIQAVQKNHLLTHDIKIARQDGKGKGDAVRKGFSLATGDILMILDADLTVRPEDLPKFYDAIASGKGEFINGSRLVYPLEKHAMRFLNTLGNKFFSVMFSWILEQPIKDTLCGTKVLFREDYMKLIKNRIFFGDFDPFSDFDLLFGAFKLNLKIVDLPVRYHERKYGSTNISRFKHGLLLLRMLVYAAGKIKFY